MTLEKLLNSGRHQAMGGYFLIIFAALLTFYLSYWPAPLFLLFLGCTLVIEGALFRAAAMVGLMIGRKS